VVQNKDATGLTFAEIIGHISLSSFKKPCDISLKPVIWGKYSLSQYIIGFEKFLISIGYQASK
jgi:hypothetical protein